MGFSALLQSLADCISHIAKYGKARVDHQEATEIIADKKDLKKAGNIAEKIIELALKYQASMTKQDQRKLKSLIKRFNKVD